MPDTPPEAADREDNKIAERYDQGFNDPSGAGGVYASGDRDQTRDNLKKDEAKSTTFGSDAKADVGQMEGAKGPEWNTNISAQGAAAIGGSASTSKKKGIAAAISTLVAFMLAFAGVYFGGGLAPLMAFSNIFDDLNDELSGLQVREDRVKRHKFLSAQRQAGSLGCTGVGSVLPIRCKFNTVSPRMADRMKLYGIEVTGNTGGVFGNRIQPTEFRWRGESLNIDQFMARLETDADLGNAYRRSQNMKFIGSMGRTSYNALRKFNIRGHRLPELTGDHENRVNQLMNRAGVSNVDDIKFVLARELIGDPPNQTERILNDKWVVAGEELTDTDNHMTQEEVDKYKESAEKLKANNKPPSQARVNALKAVSLVGWYDTACSIKNGIGSATVAAKVLVETDVAKYAKDLATMAMAAKAGHIDHEDMQVLQEFFTQTDARERLAGITLNEDANADTSDVEINEQWVEENINESEITNPYHGMSAMDSPLYKMSAGGGVASISSAELAYSLGFGSNKFLSGVSTFANISGAILNLGNLNACPFVQSAAVRAASIFAGVLLGGFSGGASLAITAGVTLGLIIASNTLNGFLSRTLAGDVITDTMDQAPVERGAAFWTGMAAIQSQTALARGMMPGNAEQIVAYQHEQNKVRQEYIALERQDSNPLDITNPHSLVGTLAFSMYSHTPKSMAALNLSSISTGLSSFVFSGFASILSPKSTYAASLNEDRFRVCDDDSYRDIGIDADVQCNVRFVMPQDVLALDPDENALWMETPHAKYGAAVEENTTTGMPKGYTPPNLEDDRSLVENIVRGQIEDFLSLRNYGGDEDTRAGRYGRFLDYCVFRAFPFGETFEESGAFGDATSDWKSGKNCFDQEYKYADEVKRFRAYWFDITLNDDLDEAPILGEGESAGGGARLSESEVRALIKEYGLPDPIAEDKSQYGDYAPPRTKGMVLVQGYDRLLDELLENPDAMWATEQMLKGEKNFMDRGGDLKEYLNTTWLWFESGSSKWADPYEVNCGDIGIPKQQMAGRKCTADLLQSSGYQAWDRRGEYIQEFRRFYSEDELVPLLEKTFTNSSRASTPEWDYNQEIEKINTDGRGDQLKRLKDDWIPSAKISDLSPDGGDIKNDDKTQFLTLLIGKDPNMSTALNSYAVTDNDVLAHIGSGEGCGPGWGGYICKPERQLMSNMIFALWGFDSRGNGPQGALADSTGLESIWGGGPMNLTQAMGLTSFALGDGAPMYGYGSDVGVDGHPGLDYGTPKGTKIYSPVSGTVIYGGGTCYFRDDELVKSDASCKNSTMLRSLPKSGELKIKVAGTEHELILGHMSRIDVSPGDPVSPGQLVGLSGTTKNVGGGDHIHIEYRVPDSSVQTVTPTGLQAVDPREYL